MNNEELKEYIETGREIEFIYKNKSFFITYYGVDRDSYISFCEFYCEPNDVKTLKNY